jgi:glycosyltransferase involved in cell wall biosynthesis
MELAEQWRAAGHTVEKFSLSDAYPRENASPPLAALQQILFAYKAAAFIRKRARDFDVIDALIGTLPFAKSRLGFAGLLVARSVGLYLLYERFLRSTAHLTRREGKLIGRIYYPLLRRRVLRDSDRAVRRADLVNVVNGEEATCLREEFGPHQQIAVLPYGLTRERCEALARAAATPEVRLAAQRISFIGLWGVRKGSRDWPRIIELIRAEVPGARFRFLGTMVDDEVIRAGLGPSVSTEVELVSNYQPDELPGLLADCTAGAFPSYVEGFGLAVIEQLAAGLPTVAYDTPGPRDILESCPRMLIPSGHVEQFAASIVRILRLSVAEYRAISEESTRVAAGFSWEKIASDTIDVYRQHLHRAGLGQQEHR